MADSETKEKFFQELKTLIQDQIKSDIIDIKNTIHTTEQRLTNQYSWSKVVSEAIWWSSIVGIVYIVFKPLTMSIVINGSSKN